MSLEEAFAEVIVQQVEVDHIRTTPDLDFHLSTSEQTETSRCIKNHADAIPTTPPPPGGPSLTPPSQNIFMLLAPSV